MRYFMLAAFLWSSSLLFAEEPQDQFIDEIDESALTHGESLARISYAGKYVYQRADDGEEVDVVRNAPVLSGDFLETRNGSYAEIQFIDGSLLQVDNRTKLEFQAINENYGDSRLTIVKLHRGSLFLHVTENPASRLFRIDTAAGSAYVDLPGIYRLDKIGSRMKLKVFRGFAELSGTDGSAPIYTGEYATIHNMSRPGSVRPFNSFHGDRFERWAVDRRPVSDGVSAKYVDSEIAYYSRDLDDHGEWRYDNDLEIHVWVPYVTVSWSPYNRGYWTTAGAAMTWVSYDDFGWVTHHYGRWGWRLGLGWYWIPGRYYSPAWVAWTTYDTYVGWCPLGYANRPWYYRDRRPNTVIINNYYGDRWNYVRTEAIVKGRRNYENHRVVYRGERRITTRNIYVNREDFSDGARFARVIEKPELNQRRIVNRNTKRGTMVSYDGDRRTRVAITGRATGTRAVSRDLSRRVVEDRIKRTETRTVERNRDSFETNRNGRSGYNSRRAETRQTYDDNPRTTVKRADEGNTRGFSNRTVTRSNSATETNGNVSRSNNRTVTRSNSRSDDNRAVTRSNSRTVTRSNSGREVTRTQSPATRSGNQREVKRTNSRTVERSNNSRTTNRTVTRTNSSSNQRTVTRSRNNHSSNSKATRKPSGTRVDKKTATRKPSRPVKRDN